MNPNNWSTYHLSAANAVNNVGMLHGYLMGKHLYGDNLEQGVAKALNTHFSMVRQDKTDLLAQFIFPYMNSSSHNIYINDVANEAVDFMEDEAIEKTVKYMKEHIK